MIAGSFLFILYMLFKQWDCAEDNKTIKHVKSAQKKDLFPHLEGGQVGQLHISEFKAHSSYLELVSQQAIVIHHWCTIQ